MQKITREKIIQVTKAVILGVLFTGLMAAAWTGPSATPPQNNAPVPINQGLTEQTRTGVFNVASPFRAIGNMIVGGTPTTPPDPWGFINLAVYQSNSGSGGIIGAWLEGLSGGKIIGDLGKNYTDPSNGNQPNYTFDYSDPANLPHVCADQYGHLIVCPAVIVNPIYACSDGYDNDSDGWTDYPDDPGCTSATDNTENPNPQCSDGIDNGDTEDSLADTADAGCHTDGNAGNAGSYDKYDNDESNILPQCSDGIDNDGDGWTDYSDDPGCTSATDNTENPNPQCSDGIDSSDPEDTLIDAADPGCHAYNAMYGAYDKYDNDELNMPAGGQYTWTKNTSGTQTMTADSGSCPSCTATHFIPPAGVTSVMIRVWGGSGGGGGGDNPYLNGMSPVPYIGGGGGAGGYTTATVSVSAVSNFLITIGNKGIFGANGVYQNQGGGGDGSNGTSGGNSSVATGATTYTGNGGGGGHHGYETGFLGAAGTGGSYVGGSGVPGDDGQPGGEANFGGYGTGGSGYQTGTKGGDGGYENFDGTFGNEWNATDGTPGKVIISW